LRSIVRKNPQLEQALRIRRFFLALPVALLLGGCAGLVEKGGGLLDGSAFREKTLSRWGEPGGRGGKDGFNLREVRLRDGTELLVIGHGAFPSLRINARAAGGGGGFYLLSLDYLSSHPTGWNEFTLDLSGTLSFSGEGPRRFLGLEAPEPVQISGGKIRHRDSRLGGREALTALRNRYERIGALTEWMRGREAPGAGDGAILDPKAFEARWKGLLLPELVPAKKRPPEYAAAGDERVRGEDVLWNAAYTRALFPEELWPLRDTGALLRDWEEALSWIRLAYYWDYLTGLLAKPLPLDRLSK
jgi:hypothetical protein